MNEKTVWYEICGGNRIYKKWDGLYLGLLEETLVGYTICCNRNGEKVTYKTKEQALDFLNSDNGRYFLI